MSVLRKANNIFNHRIMPQSLFSQQVQRDYQVDGTKIQGNWLINLSPHTYKTKLQSALDLAQKKQNYHYMKLQQKQHIINGDNNGNDVIKFSQVQYYIDNFQIMNKQSNKKYLIYQNWGINANNLVLQKIGQFGRVYQRRCRIIEKQLLVESEKNKQEIKIQLGNYQIVLQEKSKLGGGGGQVSVFPWPDHNQIRLLLYGQYLRSYCLYGDEDLLRGIINKLKIQSIKLQQINIFKLLNQQYKQNILNLFTTKLRSYGNDVRQRKNQVSMDITMELLEKSHLLDGMGKEDENINNGNNGMLKVHVEAEAESKSEVSSVRNQKSAVLQLGNSRVDDAFLGDSLRSSMVGRKKQGLKQSSQLNGSIFRKSPFRYNYDDLDHQQQVYHLQPQPDIDSLSDYKPDLQDEDLSPKKQDKSFQASDVKSISVKDQDISNSQNQNQCEMKKQVSETEEFQPYMSILDMKMKRKSMAKKDDGNPYEMKSMEMTHNIYIAYFKPFFPYSDKQLNLTFYQSVIPQLEYSGMKMPVCVLEKLTLHFDPKTQLYTPQHPLLFRVSKYGECIGVFFNNHIKQLQQQFIDINLKKVLYEVDLSQLLYFKTDNRVQCTGKLKIVISPDEINFKEYQEKCTMEFLGKWIQKNYQNREEKYQFIDYKRRSMEISQKWHNKLINKIINQSDQQQFHKAIFFGLPQKISSKLSSSLHERTLLTTPIDSPFNHPNSQKFIFTTQYRKLLQSQLKKLKIYDLRVFIQIDRLIDLVTNGRKNKYIRNRIQQICMYLHAKYGKDKVQKFMVAYTLITFKKVQPIIMTLQNAKHIEIFFEEYFDLEYEIDSVMEAVSGYFN